MFGEWKVFVEEVLGTELTSGEYVLLCNDWHAFAENSKSFENSVVVDMVRQWLSEHRKKTKEKSKQLVEEALNRVITEEELEAIAEKFPRLYGDPVKYKNSELSDRIVQWLDERRLEMSQPQSIADGMLSMDCFGSAKDGNNAQKETLEKIREIYLNYARIAEEQGKTVTCSIWYGAASILKVAINDDTAGLDEILKQSKEKGWPTFEGSARVQTRGRDVTVPKIKLYSSMDKMRIFRQLPAEMCRGIGYDDFLNVNLAVKSALKNYPGLFESGEEKYSNEEIIELTIEDVEYKIECNKAERMYNIR